MNEHKICFIYCTNDEALLQESVQYVTHLEIPEGFEVEVVAVRDAKSMASGYNYGMKQSDAKYKVYLHQDTYIINKRFIANLVQLFQAQSELGLLGMVGAARIPLSGIWWDVKEKYGKVYESHSGLMDFLEFQPVQADFQELLAIDGFLMITQYDVPWREDDFKGWHFYDISQCMEFSKAGYKVGVPHQNEPWSLHDCGVVNVRNGYEENRKKFLDIYSELLFPKVSVMIPTYNRPHYFELALKSILVQSYKNIEIIVCDDSTNDETEKLIQSYLQKHPNIRYYKNEKNLGQFLNDLQCMELAQGEYVNFLMDDDLFHPQKIEKMMTYFLSDVGSEITLVTSYRHLIDDDGTILNDLLVTQKLFEQDTILNGIDMGEHMLAIPANLIGEPSTVLFRKSDLDEPFGSFSGREYICNVDMASWLNLLTKGKIVYISEALSYFRIHRGQQQQSVKMSIGGMNDFAHQIINTPEKGYYKNPDLYVTAIQNCLKYIHHLDENLNLTDADKATPEYQETRMYYDLLRQMLDKLETDLVVQEQPLVSVLIPAYNRPHFLELALQSVLNQTYKNIEIIICDDSTNDEVQNMIQPYVAVYSQIHYYKNEKQLNYYNLQKLLGLAQGKYVNYLCDDDLFHEKKIEIMVRYMETNEQISLVTSSRKLIDESGNILPDLPFNTPLFSQDIFLEGERLGNILLSSWVNIIGEPTTVLFRRSSLPENFGVYQGYEYNKAMVDVSTWLSLLSNGYAVYIAASLSYFRQHASQNQRQLAIIVPTIREWHQLIKSARNNGYLINERDYKQALINHLKGMQNIFEKAIEAGKGELLAEIGAEECMSYAASELVHCKHDYYCPHCKNKFFSFKPWPDYYDFTKYKFEMYNKETFLCPECSAMDRERLYRLYLERETELLKTPHSLLHIAPERHIRNWLSNYKNIDYTCGDLFPADAALVKVDVTDIHFLDETFDIVMCSHVLEHVPDDRKAMRELYRVLKKGGWGILQVPLAVSITETYEDFSITTPEGRLEAFGQDGHVRIYAQQDYIKRLKEAGFEVQLYNYATKYGLNEAKKYGLSRNDNLYVVHKK